MLQRSDGDDFSTGASYLELADFIIRNGSNPDADLELALSVAKQFRLNDSNAGEIIKKAHTAVALWKSIAKNYKLSEFETDLMAPAFLPDSTRRRT